MMSQLRAPRITSEKSALIASSISAAAATGTRIAAVRSRLRSHQPLKRNRITPASVSRICLYISSGVEEAATDMPSEER